MDALDNFTLITHVRDDIRAWAAAKGVRASLSLAATTRRALELLATPPNGLFVIVVWEGEDPSMGLTDRSNIAEQAFAVFVAQQQSLAIHPGEDVLERGADGGAGLLERVNGIRDRLRALQFPDGTVESGTWYRGCEQVFDPQEVPVPLNAFRLRFTARAFLPEVGGHTWHHPTP